MDRMSWSKVSILVLDLQLYGLLDSLTASPSQPFSQGQILTNSLVLETSKSSDLNDVHIETSDTPQNSRLDNPNTRTSQARMDPQNDVEVRKTPETFVAAKHEFIQAQSAKPLQDITLHDAQTKASKPLEDLKLKHHAHSHSFETQPHVKLHHHCTTASEAPPDNEEFNIYTKFAKTSENGRDVKVSDEHARLRSYTDQQLMIDSQLAAFDKYIHYRHLLKEKAIDNYKKAMKGEGLGPFWTKMHQLGKRRSRSGAELAK